MKAFVCVSSFFFIGCLALSQGLSITQCKEVGFVSVEDRSRDLVLTCANLSVSSPTTWTYQGRNATDSPTLISNCSAHDSPPDTVSWQCSRDFDALVYAYIQPHTRRSHVILSDVDRGRYPDGTWRCQNGGAVAECAVDVVYTPKDVRCHVTVDEEQGMVEGSCQISRMFSSHDKYGCQWFEKYGDQAEMSVQSSQVLFDCSDANYQFFCGNCSFSKLLPLASESYRYRVLISPGQISPAIEINVKSITDDTPVETTSQDTDVTSEQPVTSLKPASMQTMLPTDEGKVDAARGEGIGIGIAAMLAVVICIAICVLVVWKFKLRKKETARNESERSLHAADNHAFDQTTSSQVFPSNDSNGNLPHSQVSETVRRQERGRPRSNADVSLTFPKVPVGVDETEHNPSLASPSDAADNTSVDQSARSEHIYDEVLPSYDSNGIPPNRDISRSNEVTSASVPRLPTDKKKRDLYLIPV